PSTKPAPPAEAPVKPDKGPPAASKVQASSMPAGAAGGAGIAASGPAPSTAPAKTAGAPPGATSRKLVKIVRSSSGPSMPVKPSRPSRPSSAGGKGNAVYRIDRDGFVRAVFRRPVTIWAMALRKDVLILATGHGGEVFTVDLIGDRTSMVVKLDPKDITAMAADAAGKLYLGTADKAAVYALSAGLARKGTLVSKVLDAGQIASWGSADVRADVPSWCSAKIAVRSGNVAEPDDKTWSAWSRESSASKGWTKLTAPAGRFLQYRLSLSGNGRNTPSVDQVQLVYQVRNLAPTVSAVQVVPGGDPKKRGGKGPGPKPFRMIQIKAADPNSDPLRYAIHFRRVGRKLWIKLVDK
ncbi:hypothetical protein LCGC14_3063580, partial [marine sediment metagenome]